MTFNDNADISKGRASRRGRNTGIAIGGGGGLVAVAVLVISLLTGTDLSPLLGGLGGAPAAPEDSQSLEQCETGADANESLDCRMKGAAASLEEYWSGEVGEYRGTEIVLFTESVSTACGAASSAVGPFYCPGDETVYLDTGFFTDLREQFGTSGGPLAQLYVIAHEWGHHIQNITGQMAGLDLRRSGPDSDGVRLELQADCYAGAWVGAQNENFDDNGRPFLEKPTAEELRDALDAAEAIGDDRIQETMQGQVNPESWTHGSGAQRHKWFEIGRTQGPEACDTFSIDGRRL